MSPRCATLGVPRYVFQPYRTPFEILNHDISSRALCVCVGGGISTPPPVRCVMEIPLPGAGYTVIFLVTSRALHAHCRIYVCTSPFQPERRECLVLYHVWCSFLKIFETRRNPKEQKSPVSSICAMHRSALVIAMTSITNLTIFGTLRSVV